MTTRDDMPDDPLAGIDLQAWQPPAPSAAQIDAILARSREGTRTDGAAAVEVDADDRIAPVPVRRAPVPRRSRWLAIGFAIGAAAAVLIVLAVRSGQDDTPEPTRTVLVPVPDPDPDHVGDRAGASVAASLEECRTYRNNEDWLGVVVCGKRVLERSPANTDAQGLIDQATREAKNKLAVGDLEAAIAAKNYVAARAAAERISPDSIYLTRASEMHALLLDGLRDDEVVKATALAKQGSCDLIEARARALRSIHVAASDAVLAVRCVRKLPDTGSGSNPGAGAEPCDALDLLAKAREAGAATQWKLVLKHAEASNACKPSKSARQLALLAACNLGDRMKALKYWKEFDSNTGMLQRCVGVVGDDPTAVPTPTACDAVALLNEARAAGGANQWSKVLVKAEASNKCVASKSARQLALLAACNIGDKTKAAKYWREFENNSGMQQRCLDILK